MTAQQPAARSTAPARRRDLDLRCYLVTSGTSRRTVEVASAAAAAGAGVVQVRAKEATTAALLELVLAVAVARQRGAAVHGVHLGQDDLPVADARKLLGPEAIIGLTTGTLDLVRAAEGLRDQVDYLGAGPFRRTPTKDSGRLPLGVEGYPPLVAASSLPIVAIGDVTPADAATLGLTGVAGVALVRALMEAPDPAAVVREVLAGITPG